MASVSYNKQNKESEIKHRNIGNIFVSNNVLFHIDKIIKMF